jgi:hypothetical protein
MNLTLDFYEEEVFCSLQCVEDTLAQQGKSGPAESHTLQKFQFIDTSLDDAIALRQGQTSQDSGFVALNATDHALQFTNLADADAL